MAKTFTRMFSQVICKVHFSFLVDFPPLEGTKKPTHFNSFHSLPETQKFHLQIQNSDFTTSSVSEFSPESIQLLVRSFSKPIATTRIPFSNYIVLCSFDCFVKFRVWRDSLSFRSVNVLPYSLYILGKWNGFRLIYKGRISNRVPDSCCMTKENRIFLLNLFSSS